MQYNNNNDNGNGTNGAAVLTQPCAASWMIQRDPASPSTTMQPWASVITTSTIRLNRITSRNDGASIQALKEVCPTLASRGKMARMNCWEICTMSVCATRSTSYVEHMPVVKYAACRTATKTSDVMSTTALVTVPRRDTPALPTLPASSTPNTPWKI
mmetsp:Transcript_10722/g.18849  ORF Transcript_10722/g.18849 Transcript_10722/m.18849 type:complete len:157 (-) Transcript_10722:8-478(-)